MSPGEDPVILDRSSPSLLWAVIWFGLCAAGAGWIGFRVLGGFNAEIRIPTIACLGLSGAATAVLLVRPLRWVLRERRVVVGALLGLLVALATLELGLVLTLLVLRQPIAIPAGLMLAPLYGFAGWLLGGPLSGLGWVVFVGWLWRVPQAPSSAGGDTA